MTALHRFIATAPRGLTDLLARELMALGAEQVSESAGAVRFQGAIEAGYRACLWSRVGSRVLLCLSELQAASADDFYREARQIDWSEHIAPGSTLACDFSGTHPAITHSHYGALRLKDAVVDRMREQSGARPDVELARPSVRLHAHAHGTHITLALDLSGESLHRRGYRLQSGEAPLRENLAAGVLLRARWDEAAAAGREFLDPLCGAGTLVIEAAMIAARMAPGLQREYFGFLGWRQHEPALWQALREEALARVYIQLPNVIRGSDADASVLRAAAANAARAGVAGLVRFEHLALSAVRASGVDAGLIGTNPPYGERLGDVSGARALHAELGRVLREHFRGWDAAILTAAPHGARELRLRSYRVHDLWNGPIACRLLRIDLASPGALDLMHRSANAAQESMTTPALGPASAAESARPPESSSVPAPPVSPGAEMFVADRLEKNVKRLTRTAREANVSCYRLYDADMPEYAFAIDRYEEVLAQQLPRVHLYVQEYAAPASIDVEAARRRRREALSVLPGTLGVPPERIHLRIRRPQRGASQYQPRRAQLNRSRDARGMPESGQAMMIVAEDGRRFFVNLDDYLDTGLFLDHRLTRALLADRARGRRFLNLFCYTASATVYAATAGASASLSIDLSNRYLEWARRNLQLNGMQLEPHRLLQADCREWLAGRSGAEAAERFDVIFLDPPTFSNSKRMQGVLDVQRDHVELIDQCMQRLAAGGTLIFSTNAQRFRLAPEVGTRWRVADLSRRTLPFDFQGNPRIHRCYEISAA